MRDHPRQIYTSVRKPGRLRGLAKAPALHVAGLFILVLGVTAVVIVSLA